MARMQTPRLNPSAAGRGNCTLRLTNFFTDLWSTEWACGLTARKPATSADVCKVEERSARSRRLSPSLFNTTELRGSNNIEVEVIDASMHVLDCHDDRLPGEVDASKECSGDDMFRKGFDDFGYTKKLQACEDALDKYARKKLSGPLHEKYARFESRKATLLPGGQEIPKLQLRLLSSCEDDPGLTNPKMPKSPSQIGGQEMSSASFGSASLGGGTKAATPGRGWSPGSEGRSRPGLDSQASLRSGTPRTPRSERPGLDSQASRSGTPRTPRIEPLMLTKRYLSNVTNSGNDETELSDEELFLDERYSAVSRRIGQLPVPTVHLKEELATTYLSNMTYKFDHMGLHQERVGNRRRRSSPRKIRDPAAAVKRGVRDYHGACITLNSYYATPTSTPRPEGDEDRGLTISQRQEHKDAEHCLDEPVLSMAPTSWAGGSTTV